MTEVVQDTDLMPLFTQYFALEGAARQVFLEENKDVTLFYSVAKLFEQALAGPVVEGEATEVLPSETGFVNLVKPGDYVKLLGLVIMRVNGRGVHKRKAQPLPGSKLEADWFPAEAEFTVSGGVELYDAMSRPLPGFPAGSLRGPSIKAKEHGWALRSVVSGTTTVLTFPSGVYQVLKENN